jgi:hypothetical protein
VFRLRGRGTLRLAPLGRGEGYQFPANGLLTIIVAGASFLGNLTGDVFKDEIKEGIESWLKDTGPKIVQKVDSVVAKELPAGVANSFHNAVKNYIDNSPEKTELKPPPSK